MGRLADTFARLRARDEPGLVAYVTAGDPTLARTSEILVSLSQNGADVIEVGVPFSDPLADGPVIQRASERALAGGATLRRALDMIRETRARIASPIVLFSYANPILRMGEDAFVRTAAAAGVDGVLVLDLPIEEAASFRGQLVERDLDPVFLLSPTTTDVRIRAAAELGRGFLYVISRLGVTGVRDQLAADVEPLVRRIRAQSSLPLALGFGISTPEHVAAVSRWADAAVVGSALVSVIAEHGASSDVAARAGAYVRWLKGQPS
ncbi:MAG TPA: tryptophan synthase subunit alpha [Vicinamibacterales bacterium]|jgi:tryptophan synthase alpha chain